MRMHNPAKSITTCLVLLVIVSNIYTQNTGDYPIKPVEFTQVHFSDQFWEPRLKNNIGVTIPSSFKKCEETGRIDNFQVAGNLKKGVFRGVFPFDDSDVYKIIEGASYALAIRPDPQLSSYLDTVIMYIAAAQEPDGYLQTWRTIDPFKPPTDWSGDENRWSNIESGHELYNVGHLYEAAVAHYKATGKRTLLDVALKNANLIVNIFGPGKIITVPGHEEIEIGLIKLYRVTGNKHYLDQARFFIEHRGKIEGRDKLFGEYNQDHIPVLRQTEAVGHAVRAAYLYSAMTDVGAVTGDTSYLHALGMIWDNVVSKKIYLTGGIGARRQGESFGDNYELPNFTAYNETCAAIANILWNYRMFLMHGDAKYMDVLERTLYNGMIAGVSLSGDHFFYPNPLASNGEATFNMGSCTRSAWFDCSCCPSNVTRFIPSIPGYVYAIRDNQLYVNLFIGNTAELEVSGNRVAISQTTGYPWDNKIRIVLKPEESAEFSLKLRIPGWARNEVMAGDLYHYTDEMEGSVSITVNGTKEPVMLENGYSAISRVWNNGDVVELSLPMNVRIVASNAKVAENLGKIAVECGPIVYCAEGIDNTADVLNATLSESTVFEKEFKKDLLGGISVIRTVPSIPGENELLLIPYYGWSNRGVGKMAVWFTHK
ncbi:MAG TPA: glycoside hydrolase family 127 protein [Bacteroidales bacterium]|nr:glycoside hydrolase family 127 protein [Bacteroidales bacterium]